MNWPLYQSRLELLELEIAMCRDPESLSGLLKMRDALILAYTTPEPIKKETA